jgi:hypothetical protein
MKYMKGLSVPNPSFDLSNNELDAEHSFHVGATGSGKTSSLTKLKFISESDQVVFFDPYGDYKKIGRSVVKRFSSYAEFVRALMVARASKTAKGFKYAWTPKEGACEDTLEAFSAAVWVCGNGYHKKRLHAVYEEMAKCVRTTGKLIGYSGHVATGGRKFGIVAHYLFQRGQEVPKTIIGSCPYKWIGYQERDSDAKYLANEIGLSLKDILILKKLEYLLKNPDCDRGESINGVIKFSKK